MATKIFAKTGKKIYCKRMYMTDLATRLRLAREAAGLNQSELARAVDRGCKPQNIQKLEAGETHDSKYLPYIAEVLNTTVPALKDGASTDRLALLRAYEDRVPVLGVAAAGLWREVDGEEVLEHLPLVKSEEYLGFRHFALRVEGQSMNKILQDGSYAICIDMWSLGGAQPRVGDTVAVERRRMGGQEKELTIKKVGLVDGALVLVPVSTDPHYQSPLPLSGEGGDVEVEIIGLVIGTYTKL